MQRTSSNHSAVAPPSLCAGSKFVLLLGGVAIPIVSHVGIMLWVGAAADEGIGGPTGAATGQTWAAAGSFGSLLGVYPLIAFAMICYAWLLSDLPEHAHERWVRFGLFTGLPIAVAGHGYELSQLGFSWRELTIYHLLAAVLATAAWSTWKGLTRLHVRWSYSAIATVFVWTGMLSLLSSLYVVFSGDTSSAVWVAFPLMTAIVAVVLFGPLIWLTCLAWLGWRLLQRYPVGRQFSISGLMAWVTWMGVFFAACRYAIASA
jgi:hypothetical protein